MFITISVYYHAGFRVSASVGGVRAKFVPFLVTQNAEDYVIDVKIAIVFNVLNVLM